MTAITRKPCAAGLIFCREMQRQMVKRDCARISLRYAVGEACPIEYCGLRAMPKVAIKLSKSVFYLFRKDPGSGKLEGPFGTGFFVRWRSTVFSNLMVWHYAVTNHHVAIRAGATIIRINTIGGGSRYLEFQVADWQFVDGGDDVCAVAIDRSTIMQSTDEWDAIEYTDFLDKDDIEKQQIGLGENAFMIGLFASHHGGERNVPSARFGNVSMIAHDSAPVQSSKDFRRPAHIVDMRSRTGFSGSPVFIYRTPIDNLDQKEPPWSGDAAHRKDVTMLRLLGIHAGQFNDIIKVRKTTDAQLEALEFDIVLNEYGDGIKTGDHLVIPGGMTIVVPSWRIKELLHLPVFERPRRELLETLKQEQLDNVRRLRESQTPKDTAGPGSAT
jgi:hypothetical protein